MTTPKQITIQTESKEDAEMYLAQLAGVMQKLLISKELSNSDDKKVKSYAKQQFEHWCNRGNELLKEIDKTEK